MNTTGKSEWITTRLFELIYEPADDDIPRKENLQKIGLLLRHSAEYKKFGLSTLEIDFAVTMKFEYKTKKDSGDENHSLLAAAIEMRKIEVVKLLIDAGMSPSDGDASLPPLSYAARKNDKEIASLLLDAGANINAHNPKKINATALFIACRHDAYDVAKLLLLNHIDMELKNTDCRIASYYAIPNKMTNLLNAAAHLKDAIRKLNSESDFFEAVSVLEVALKCDSSFVLSYLTKMTATVNLRGQGVIHDAAYYHPLLLRVAIKHLKTYINTFPLFTSTYFPQGFHELTEQLNAYDSNSEYFASSELIFKSAEEKLKTLRWFEQGTSIENTKSCMREGIIFSNEESERAEESKEEKEKEKEIEKTGTGNHATSLVQTLTSSTVNSPIFVHKETDTQNNTYVPEKEICSDVQPKT